MSQRRTAKSHDLEKELDDREKLRAMSQRRLAISYSRFSDPKQAKGDSETRQDEMFRAFCARHNLTPLTEVFADRGRSGYKDEHRKKGRLGQLIAMAKDGRFEAGTVIVVEAWDRLGRLRPDRQTDLIAELLRTGVSIGVCRLDDIFSEDDFGTHKWTTLAVFIQMAYQESKQKAERVAASWQRRRERTRDGGELLTTRLPAWLEMGADGQPRLIPERAAAVRRIFRLAAEGMGLRRILIALEREKVRPFGEVVVSEGRSRSQFAGRWTRSYLTLILNDRRAVGELQPCVIKDGRKVPDGPPVAGYFPAAVTEEEFLLARAGQEGRLSLDRNGKRQRPRQGKHVNVFKGLLTQALDGEGFMVNNQGTREAPRVVLINNAGIEGRGPYTTFPYAVFEEAVLRLLCEVDPRDVLPSEKQARSRADVLRAKLAGVRADVANLQADLKQGYSKALAAVLRDREAAEEEAARELQEELASSVRPAAKAWQELPGLFEMIHKADDPDAVRLRIRTAVRRVVEDVRVLIVRRASWQLCVAQVHFAGGERRDYLIANQSAANRRPGGWRAKSLADVIDAGDLDLRDPEDAADLSRTLERVDVALLAAALK
jgi:DNA invertase Pin-like site-specific DNA recombinase